MHFEKRCPIWACRKTVSRPVHVIKLRPGQGNAKVERSIEELQDTHYSERSLQSDNSINANRLIKYVIKVTGSGHAHKMPITPSMQVRQSAYAVYTKRMEEQKARKDKDMQQNAKTDNEDEDTQNIPKELESRKRSLSEGLKETGKT